jgi:plasmid stabilization system protein ParE
MGKRTLVRTVYWSDTAKAQLKHIFDYWAARNKSTTYSIKIRNQVFELTSAISKNPFAFRKASNYPIHIAPMGHFSLYYQITNQAIHIVSFWDNRQDPKKLLPILKEAPKSS